MSSNDNEHAQSGDMIEITTHLRNDLGKRMQVSTSDGLSVVALDNRMRVTVAHGDYKVVRRCGRPATDDAPKRKVGRPSNAELAARAAAERTPPAVEVKAPVVTAKTDRPARAALEAISKLPVITERDRQRLEDAQIEVHNEDNVLGAPAVVTDTDVAGLEAAIYDVQVTRKVALAVDESKVSVVSGDVSPEAAAALGVTTNTPPKSQASAPAEQGPADKPAPGERKAALDDTFYDAIRYGIGAMRIEMEPIKPLTLTQEQFDAMTTHVEPRGFVAPERKYTHYFKDCPFDVVDVYRVLSLFNVTDPCLQHAVKKLLVAGGRGHKDIGKDIQETIDALERWQDMRDEEAAA